MAKKQEFEDPLGDIDPIMEQAYSVSHEVEESHMKSPGNNMDLNNTADEVLTKNYQAVRNIQDPQSNSEIKDQHVNQHDHRSDSEDLSQESNEIAARKNDNALFEDSLSSESIFESKRSTISDPISLELNKEEDIDYDISDIEFPSLTEVAGEKLDKNLFHKIPMNVSVEIGRSKISLKEVFELTEGAIIELDRLVGEPLDLVVNGQVIAQGEVVAIDNNYGLRVTNIIAKFSS
tara:strand:+ start:18 stop:719 length:702 start_codon:yes stop_codon:yes gene_type:complete